MPSVCSEEPSGAHHQVVSVVFIALNLQLYEAFAFGLVGTRKLTEAPCIDRSPYASFRSREHRTHFSFDEREILRRGAGKHILNVPHLAV